MTTHGHLVYVLNGLDGGSIQGYYRLGHHLRLIPRWNRSLDLPAGDPQFTHTPGQVTFSPNGSKLVVTTKAAANSIDVFDVGLSRASVCVTGRELPRRAQSSSESPSTAAAD